MRRMSLMAAAATLLVGIAAQSGARGAELTVLAAAAVQEPLEAVVQAFERESGDKVRLTLGSVGAISAKLNAGEKADVVISSTPAVAAAEQEGAVRPGTRATVGRVEIGVAVREGAPVPDISTTEAFKKALLAAKSVSFTDPAGGGTAAVFMAGLLQRLGLADAIKSKATTYNAGHDVITAVARGDAEIGIGFTSEFVTVKGVKVAGTLPKEIEFVNEYSAYVPAASAAPQAAGALIAYLTRSSSRDVFRAGGVAP
jgi:molybdate transport system substrate-binding protein